MALEYAHGRIEVLSSDTATTTKTVSGLAFQPKALRFWWVGINSATDATSDALNSHRGMGFAVGTSARRCVASFSQDGAGNANCGTVARDDAVMCTTDGAGGSDGEVDLNAINSDGFQLIVDDQLPVSVSIFWEAWGGSDITAAVVGDIAEPAATGNQDYTATGMVSGATDQMLFLAGVQSVASVNTAEANDSGLCIGLAHNSSEQVVWTGNSDDGSATMDTDHYALSGECLAQITNGGGNPNAIATFVQWGTDNFRLNWTARATSNRRSIFMAVKGGQWAVGEYTINVRTVNNTATVSGLAFQPVGFTVLAGGGAEETSPNSSLIDVLCIGCASSTSSRRAMSMIDQTAVADAAISIAIDYDAVMVLVQAGSIAHAHDVNAINSDGFQIIIDTADAAGSTTYWVGYAAWGNNAAGQTYTKSQTDNLTIGEFQPRSAFRGRVLSEEQVVTDQPARGAMRGRLMSDALDLSDLQVKIVIKGRAAGDTLEVTDSAARVLLADRLRSDALDVTDAPATTIGRGRVLGESLTISELSAANIVKARMAADALVIADAQDRIIERGRAASDDVTVTDQQPSFKIRGRVNADMVTVADAALQLSVLRGRVHSDGMTVADELRRSILRGRLITDTIALFDEVIYEVFEYEPPGDIITRNVLEGVEVVESISAMLLRGRVAADATAIADSVVRGLTRGRLFGESVTVQDFALASLVRVAVLAESVALQDNCLKFLLRGRAVFDLLEVSDQFTGVYLPGQLYEVRIRLGAERTRLVGYDLPISLASGALAIRLGGE